METSNYMNVVRSDIDTLKSHHISLSWFRLAEIALFIGIVFGMYVHTVRKDAEAMGKFQQMFEEYRNDSAKAKDELKASYEQRIKDEQERKKTETIIVDRTKANEIKTGAVLAQTDATKVQEDFYGAYKRSLTFDKNNIFSMDMDTVKLTTVAKLNADTLKVNFEDSQKNNASLKTSLDSALGDLKKEQGLRAQCDTSLTQLQKVKTPSKAKRVFTRVLDFGVGFLIAKGLSAL